MTLDNQEKASLSAYDELVQNLQEIKHLSHAKAVLGWDQMVMMPQNDEASEQRGKQKAALATVIHDKSIDPKIGQLLQQAEAQKGMGDEAKRVLELARRDYDKKTKIPTELEARKAALSAESYNLWNKAKTADDYSMFQKSLGDCIEISKQVASLLQTPEEKAASKPLYATMMDEYEVGMDPARIDVIFKEIEDALVPLIDRVLGPDAKTPASTEPLKGDFPVQPNQEELNKQIIRAMGFDFDSKGRVDVSVHPFTTSFSPHDVRITSRFRTDEWYQGLAGSMHEAGHAMYEQNLGDSGLPIDEALSMGMHESQSLFWERHIGLSREFWHYATPLVQEQLKITSSPEKIYRAVNASSRSLIRVEADELTYPLHVILRYNIERDFIEGHLDVKDIPQRWNKGMKDMLKIDVPSDAKGCLQDIHWSMLAYGYFPTYLLGAATAAQFAFYCKNEVLDFDQKVSSGDFKDIKAWLNEKVHKHGSRYKSLDAHLEAQLGEKLNPRYLIDYLTKKYIEIYRC
jgi:carboxypeptidase Taq